MRLPISILTSLLLVAQAVPAQEETTAGSPLTIITNDPEIAEGMLEAFDSDAAAPETGDGKVAILSLDEGGQVNARSGEGNVWLRIEARPAQLMDVFGAQMMQYQQMAQMMGGMALGQQGFDFEEVNKMVTAVFAFPKQVDRAVLVIAENPDATKSLDLSLDLSPVAGTWFGKLVANLQPNAAGVKRLVDESALLSLDTNFDVSKVIDQLKPLIAVSSSIGQQGKEARAKAADLYLKFYEACSGSMSIVFEPGSGARGLVGLADPGVMGSLLESDDYLEIQKAAAEASDMAEATIEPSAFTHRDVQVAKTSIEFDNPDMAPFAQDGIMNTFTAIADDVMIMTMFGGDEVAMKASIDRVLDQQLKTVQLPGGALAVMTMDMVGFVDFIGEMSGGMGGPDPDEVPARVDVKLAKAEGGLHLKVLAK
jgi:hypothetical protein